MVELHIKEELLPKRCEICHQTDCFDASINYCSRCSKSAVALTKGTEKSEQHKITANVKLEWSLYWRSSFWYLYRRVSLFFTGVIGVLGLLLYAGDGGRISEWDLGSLIVGYGISVIVITPCYCFYSMKKQYAALSELKKDIRYTVSSDGIEITSGKSIGCNSEIEIKKRKECR